MNQSADDVEPARSSFVHTVINMVVTLTGLGQLSAAYAVAEGGWVCALIFLIGLAIMCGYSCYLLGRCMEKNPMLRNYIDIGEKAFGRKGKISTTILIYTEIFLALVSFTISLHDNLFTIFRGWHYLNHLHLPKFLSPSQFLTILAVLVAMPSLWLRDLSSISFLSSGGAIMTLVIFFCVAATPVFGSIKANHPIPVLRIRNVPSVCGLFIFGYGGHFVFPDLYKSMRDPSKFNKVIIVSFSWATLMFSSMGFMGVKFFGAQVKSQITLSMPKELVVTQIALWAAVITPITKYALMFAPFAMHLQRMLPPSMSDRRKRLVRGAVGSLLLLVILVLALTVPYFEDVLSLTGSLTIVFMSLILPCAFYVKIFWGEISKTVLIFNLCLITLGLLLGVMGNVSTCASLVKKLQRRH